MLNQHHIKIILCKWQREFMYDNTTEHNTTDTTRMIRTKFFASFHHILSVLLCLALFSFRLSVSAHKLYLRARIIIIIIIHKSRSAFDDGSF